MTVSTAPPGECTGASEGGRPVEGALAAARRRAAGLRLASGLSERPDSRTTRTTTTTTAAPATTASTSTHRWLHLTDSRRALIALRRYLACCPRAEKKLTSAGPAPMTSAAAADIRAADRPRIA